MSSKAEELAREIEAVDSFRVGGFHLEDWAARVRELGAERDAMEKRMEWTVLESAKQSVQIEDLRKLEAELSAERNAADDLDVRNKGLVEEIQRLRKLGLSTEQRAHIENAASYIEETTSDFEESDLLLGTTSDDLRKIIGEDSE